MSASRIFTAIRIGTGRALRVVSVGLLLVAPGLADGGRVRRPQEMPYDTGGRIPALGIDYGRTDPEVVAILNHYVRPRLVNLRADQRVAWVSYARMPSVIVFESEVAKSIVCRSIVNFSLRGDELRSAPIHVGEFANFCQLKPGHYRYKVVRELADSSRAIPLRLDGEIIVADN